MHIKTALFLPLLLLSSAMLSAQTPDSLCNALSAVFNEIPNRFTRIKGDTVSAEDPWTGKPSKAFKSTLGFPGSASVNISYNWNGAVYLTVTYPTVMVTDSLSRASALAGYEDMILVFAACLEANDFVLPFVGRFANDDLDWQYYWGLKNPEDPELCLLNVTLGVDNNSDSMNTNGEIPTYRYLSIEICGQ